MRRYGRSGRNYLEILVAILLLLRPWGLDASPFSQTWAWRTICQGLSYTGKTARLAPGLQRAHLVTLELLRYGLSGEAGAVRLQLGYEISGVWRGQKTPFEDGGVSPVGRPGDARLPNLVDTHGVFRRSERSLVSGIIERMQASWRSGTVDIDLGRQPVSLGTSHFIGVLDVLAPFSPGYLDSTFKPGIDAVRLRARSGETGEAELILVPARSMRERAVLGRLRRSHGGIDAEVVAGRFRSREMAGIGWEGEKRGWN
ncbi:MAG TPA: hypothetical protein VIV61_04975, partial [Candidatus Ozemobacteraceae bacterium]